MAGKETCCTGGNTTLIAACSGRSNVGQIANQVMVEVDKMGGAKSFCLAGVGAGLSGFVESAKAGRVIVVDGCPMGCGKKVLEKYDVEPFRYFVDYRARDRKGRDGRRAGYGHEDGPRPDYV